MLRHQPHFLVEFAEHRLLRRLSTFDATLGKLPGMLSNPLAPENLVPCVTNNNADVGAVTLSVEHDANPSNLSAAHFP
jgi:hypothetical protein